MEDTANTRIEKDSNLVSRNRPVALVVNACTFLATYLITYLLEKNIQVIGIEDLSIVEKRNLEQASKNKNFHLLNEPIDNDLILNKFSRLDLPRLDYAFFITDKTVADVILGKGIINFINIARGLRESDRPRLVFSSTINLYGRNLTGKDRIIKESEAKFAKGIKHFKLNGRVLRLAEIYGPGMELDEDNMLSRLIAATINDKLEDEKTSSIFSERSLYITDAVKLLAKSILSGATSNKIFDGALLHPLRLSEIKQILVNQVWSDENPPELTMLPPWPTPNLVKTMKELAWAPKSDILQSLKETVAYFKERPELVPKVGDLKKFTPSKSWSFSGTGFLSEGERGEGKGESNNKSLKFESSPRSSTSVDFDKEYNQEQKKTFSGKTKSAIRIIVIVGLLIYGLIWPFIYLGYQGLSAKNHLLTSRDFLEEGNFSQAEAEIEKAKWEISEFKNVLDNAGILKRMPITQEFFEKAKRIVDLALEGTDGILYATRGSKSLFETTKIISGQSRGDPGKFYEEAQRNLQFASGKLAKVYANLGDDDLKAGLPEIIADRIDDLRVRVAFYQSLVEQAKSASVLMPEITAIGGKKSYLVLLQNNLELRPAGGFIGSYARLDFENGRLKDIKVDDIYNLDGALSEVIAPPQDLKNDLGIERLYLRDSNYEPDFPTAARQASFFYRKEAGQPVQGVIAMDLKASGNLLDAVGGLDLPEYGEAVNGSNLFEKAISHAETNFFPGSQAKKNYLTSLQTQLFNKIFYLSKQNWPAIIQAIDKSLKEKHILVYLEDPSLFSYLASSNWSGVFSRGADKREGETDDFLAVIESNMGANKANYYLQRKLTLNSSFTKEGKIMHKLKIYYKNTSPSDVFPAGKYKNRIKIYIPFGTKLTKAKLDETDITNQFIPFSDYGRSAFSALIQIAPKEQKTLLFEYELLGPLNFVNNSALYRMEIFKQPGIMSDPLDFILTYPINYKVAERPEEGDSGVQEIKIDTDMRMDRVFQFKIQK